MQDMPAFSVPVEIRRFTPPPAAEKPQRAAVLREAPAAPLANIALGMNVAPSDIPAVVAVSINPPPPRDQVQIPVGNRSGEFAAAPDGLWTQGGGIAEGMDLGLISAEQGRPVAEEAAKLQVAGLSVSGDKPVTDRPVLPIVQHRLQKPSPEQDRKQLLASLSRPNLRPEFPLRGQPQEDEYFGRRRVYTAQVNMPNLSSRTGSWVLRFAEPKNSEAARGELATPEVIRKVDPAYEAGAMRERIEGVVMLAALVLRDGSVANIRVVKGLDARLDTSAVAALTQWRFEPATRDGRPVELEVLVQIPFAASSF